jgi:hypothetical protein
VLQWLVQFVRLLEQQGIGERQKTQDDVDALG